MKASYVDHAGTDLSVVNAARVSFAKKHEEFDKDKDERLIRYLARHGHWTPFGHTSITIHCKAPIFVARQLGKHQVGLVWNEVSRRYVDSEPEFYQPSGGWRLKADNVKQGSSDETIPKSSPKINIGIYEEDWVDYEDFCQISLDFYRELLKKEVSPEMARMVLPQSMYTEWYWTGSVAAFARVCNLRLDPHTQKETRDITSDIAGIIEPLFPVSWSALMHSDQ